jgi:hypothetical protein
MRCEKRLRNTRRSPCYSSTTSPPRAALQPPRSRSLDHLAFFSYPHLYRGWPEKDAYADPLLRMPWFHLSPFKEADVNRPATLPKTYHRFRNSPSILPEAAGKYLFVRQTHTYWRRIAVWSSSTHGRTHRTCSLQGTALCSAAKLPRTYVVTW